MAYGAGNALIKLALVMPLLASDSVPLPFTSLAS